MATPEEMAEQHRARVGAAFRLSGFVNGLWSAGLFEDPSFDPYRETLDELLVDTGVEL